MGSSSLVGTPTGSLSMTRRKGQVVDSDRVFSRSSASFMRVWFSDSIFFFVSSRLIIEYKDSPTPSSSRASPSHDNTPLSNGPVSATKASSSKNASASKNKKKNSRDANDDDDDETPQKRLRITYGRDWINTTIHNINLLSCSLVESLKGTLLIPQESPYYDSYLNIIILTKQTWKKYKYKQVKNFKSFPFCICIYDIPYSCNRKVATSKGLNSISTLTPPEELWETVNSSMSSSRILVFHTLFTPSLLAIFARAFPPNDS